MGGGGIINESTLSADEERVVTGAGAARCGTAGHGVFARPHRDRQRAWPAILAMAGTRRLRCSLRTGR